MKKLYVLCTLLGCFCLQMSWAQQKSVTGTVLDEFGGPLPGATVIVEGTSRGVPTDFDGNFNIQVSEGETLLVTYLGYADSHLVHLLDGTTARALSTPGDNLRYANYFLDDGARTLINTSSGGRFSQTSAFPLASYYENQLILAEAKFQTNDETGARTHLNNVRSELRVQFGSDTVGFPDSSASGNDLLKHILEEKFITLVGEIVTFHDLRRTRNFIAVPNKTTGSTGANDFPQRFLYPQSEVDTNENIPSPLPEFFSTTELLGGSY